MENLKVECEEGKFVCEYHQKAVMEKLKPEDWDIVKKDKSMRQDIERHLIAAIQGNIIKDVCQYLSHHSQKADISYYGETTKIHQSPHCPEDDVLVIMHPKRMADLLVKRTYV